MSDSMSVSRVLQGHLDRLRNGDELARDDLIAHACDRLVSLTRKMLGRYSRLRAWEQTDDVAQNAMMRLRRALASVQPTTIREFYGLASEQIRRELLDLTRHYFGREGRTADEDGRVESPKPQLARLPSQLQAEDENLGNLDEICPGDETNDPGKLDFWKRFHDAVRKLPDVEREVAELLWYQELTQEDAAEILQVDKSTVKRRWRSARLKLSDVLRDFVPEEEL